MGAPTGYFFEFWTDDYRSHFTGSLPLLDRFLDGHSSVGNSLFNALFETGEN